MLTDPISDMLTRIRNATLARHERVAIPASKLKRSVAEILVGEGYISSVQADVDDKGHDRLVLVLKYDRERQPAIEGIRRVSRPGRRVYVGHDKIGKVRNGLGISVLSTSRGVMSDRQARTAGVGGELLCEVW
ncbi:MAG: 30S ribosomal protein S8 [Myxococcales bacterium]|nr:30S ribosomal protein S8 [Myxococcales bacterium]